MIIGPIPTINKEFSLNTREWERTARLGLEQVLDVIKAIKEFYDLHKDDVSLTEKAATKCKHLLHWFYVAEKDEDEDGITQIHFA